MAARRRRIVSREINAQANCFEAAYQWRKKISIINGVSAKMKINVSMA
jgi:hypothetical protein